MADPKIIKKTLLPKEKLGQVPGPEADIPFGRIHTDHMLVCDYIASKGGWQTPEIKPYGPFEFNPSAVVFHYGQQIFEGLKAYRAESNTNEIYLFRPDLNAKRFHNSAVLLGMQPVSSEMFLQSIKELVLVDQRWIMPSPCSLYVRPALIPLDEGVSYRASIDYRFFVILSPAKNYYSAKDGVTVFVERTRSRAVVGGVGEAKCGGNYAGALASLNKAKSLGADQVLWLDAHEHSFVEEVGAMNIMFVYKDKIVTPKLTGSILPGVTRTSLIDLARSLGISVEEKRIHIDEAIADIKAGKLTEVFGCGTAAVISPVSRLLEEKTEILINEGKTGDLTLRLKKAMTDLQSGLASDPHGWRFKIN